ncbi:damage-inducible protein DinB [Echinicola strongylocentroti]|uniref:Damage-inducible protein DinB n=1 Tax=Echinicola strongylocentroti TaxID=1795355 RepID=A0A2Z4IQ37_9BACT|nr:DinB family protein [Echinicola strongylocentroti]AWW33035.1 damage-inducible protein DinB [Echinicola strongylocentroti]
MKTESVATSQALFISTEAMLAHWQGHRNLTRRTIELFPEDKLFDYSVGGMRPFAHLAMEMIDIAVPGVKGLASGEWEKVEEFDHTKSMPTTKEGLLELWDKATQVIDETWPSITSERFQKVEVAFGQYENSNYATLLYFVDNEIHHRGQGYVYLRSLGIEPPFFWER